MEKYQQENPNNCRVSINWNDKKNPVKFEYVGTDTALKVCTKFFRQKIIINFLLTFMFISGMIFEAIMINNNQLVKYIFLFVWLLMFLYFYYVAPILLGFLFSRNKKLLKLMPYLWSWGKTLYHAEFTPCNLIDNKLEIPLYSNVILKYELTEDFSELIDRLEIIEHPFNIITRKGLNKRKIKRNEYLWKATFYFKETPKNGQLNVSFY